MKVQTAFKLTPQIVDILRHVHNETGVGKTTTIEKLVLGLGRELALLDPGMAKIMEKTPKMYEVDRKGGQGVYKKRWTRDDLRAKGAGQPPQ